MKKSVSGGILAVVALVLAVHLAASRESRAEEARANTTLDNLMAAYNGESNAHARYLAFARKADGEGYAQAATLFRAAARAEETHAGEHARVIERMGATPKADIQATEVRSTPENLAAAEKGEIYERDVMYPAFIKQARAEQNTAALRTFNYALTAEKEHAKFYGDARANPDQWKAGTRTFYVCTVCGYTTTALPAARCVSCANPREKYEKVT